MMLMYLQKEISIKPLRKNYFLLGSWTSLTKKQDPELDLDLDLDPLVKGAHLDPYQNVTDPEDRNTGSISGKYVPCI
jgi:hypothetical protein